MSILGADCVRALLALCVLLFLSSPSFATTITFDDLDNNGAQIPTGYAGFDWTNFGTFDGSINAPQSGFSAGTVSPGNVAYNGSVDPPIFCRPIFPSSPSIRFISLRPGTMDCRCPSQDSTAAQCCSARFCTRVQIHRAFSHSTGMASLKYVSPALPGRTSMLAIPGMEFSSLWMIWSLMLPYPSLQHGQ
jgi:hypothetical protein